MNVKSKFDSEEQVGDAGGSQNMRGMCGIPYEMFSGPARVDTTGVKVPKFIQKIFRAMGWKTQAGQSQDN